MEIKSTITDSAGNVFDLTYQDTEDDEGLGGRTVKGVHAYCFYKDKLLVVYSHKSGEWTPPGGGVEAGESVAEAVTREVQEESNMNVLAQRLIGFQDISERDLVVTQTRSVCLVEPYGPFISDPDGDITEIRLIDPKDYKEYFDWKVVGDHIMQRALELKGILER